MKAYVAIQALASVVFCDVFHLNCTTPFGSWCLSLQIAHPKDKETAVRPQDLPGASPGSSETQTATLERGLAGRS